MFHRIRVRNAVTAFIAILRWSVVALLIGTVCGFAGTLFYYGVGWADGCLAAHPALLFFLPAAGLLIVFLNRRLKTDCLSTDSVILAVQKGNSLPVLLIPAIFAGTVLTHLFGGSAGREGAAFQIGGTVGNRMAKLLRQNEFETQIATMAGMAALFSSIFGLPVTATLFVVLVISVGDFWHSSIYPVMIASLTAYGISGAFGVPQVAFAVTAPAVGIGMTVKVGILAVLCAFLSTILCDGLHDTEQLLEEKMPNPYIRIILTGIAIVLIMLVVGGASGDFSAWNAPWMDSFGRSRGDPTVGGTESLLSGTNGTPLIYSGAGSNLIQTAIEEGRVRPWDFALKLVLTVLTLAAGFKGGEVLPSFAIGATFGCLVGPFLGIPAEFAAAVGLISVFGGAANSLIAPVFLGVEMFGAEGLEYYAIAAVFSYIMSGYAGFYYNQVIVYSKISPMRILIHANAEHDQRQDVPGEKEEKMSGGDTGK